MPLVSVLVPVHNDAAFLNQALCSVAAQTFKDFEVVVCDDASEDGGLSIARQWAVKDDRFKVFANDEKLGMTLNWNRALSNASGRYVVKLDSDDAMQPRCLELLTEEMENSLETYVAFCRTLSCDENLEPVSSYLGDNAFVLFGLDPLIRHLRSGHDFYTRSFSDFQLWSSNAQIHRRENLVEMGGWDATWGCASDTDLILRVLERGKTVAHIPYAGILYRNRPRSVSDSFRKNGWLRWEGTLILLLSLGRYYASGDRLNSRLRREWWRYWRNLAQLRTESDVSSFPEPIRTNLALATRSITRPPMKVMLEGRLRQTLWHLKRKVLR